MNPIPINCVCGKRFKVSPELRGKITRCPRCGRKHIIPEIYRDIPEKISTEITNKDWLLLGFTDVARVSLFSFFLAALTFVAHTALKVLEINLGQDLILLGLTFLFLSITFVLGVGTLRWKQNRSWVLIWAIIVSLLLTPIIALETIYTYNEQEKTQEVEEIEEIIPLDLTEDTEEDF